MAEMRSLRMVQDRHLTGRSHGPGTYVFCMPLLLSGAGALSERFLFTAKQRPTTIHRKEVSGMANRPKYEAPRIVTYHEDEILEELGPAQACTSPCPVP